MVYRLIAAAIVGFGWHGAVLAAWPPEVETAVFTSPADGPEQKTLLYAPPGDDPGPLLVAFHTCSGDYRQDEAPYAEWCIARGWAFVHPDVRGPANRKEAAGSDLAFADLRGAPFCEVKAGDRSRANLCDRCLGGRDDDAPGRNAEAERIPDTAIEAMVRDRMVPGDLGTAAADPLSASKPVLFLRTSGSARLTIFDGGHDIVHEAGLTWLEAQRRGTPAAWDTKPNVPPVLKRPAAASGK